MSGGPLSSSTRSPGSRGTAVVLAAGRGTRMRSRLAKVLHEAVGRPLASWAVGAAQEAGLDVVAVVHHQEDAVRAALGPAGVRFARQESPRGTGDAVASALPQLPEDGVMVVLCGDGPLVRSETLTALLDAHGPAGSGPRVTVLTVELDDAGAYGRLLRDDQGRPLAIMEAAEASPEQLAIGEINSGIYAIDIAWLRQRLPGFAPHPPKNEIYLTDCVALAAAEGRAAAVTHDDEGEILGVNDRRQLAQAARILQDRILDAHLRAGVTMEDPASVTVEPGVELGQDVVLERGVVLRGSTRVGAGTVIGAHSVLIDAELAESCRVRAFCHLEGARVDEGAVLGPYARLRPGAELGSGAKIGNFVEVKKSRIAPGAKVNHLSYIGDAEVGAGANVGAGTITCNYDGTNKHRTVIGAGAFIGSNSALVAPVEIGAGAIVGAGSVITGDVPDNSLAIARGRQSNLPDRAPMFREQAQALKASRKAAAAADSDEAAGQ